MSSRNPPLRSAPPLTDKIRHIVLLMFENRSFDNMLGGLNPSLGQNQYRGLNNISPPPSNPLPHPLGSDVSVWQGEAGAPGIMEMPYPDPGELFVDMNQQIFNPPPDGMGSANMMGFAANYAKQKTKRGVAPNPVDIMQYYSSENVPVTHGLAHGYAVCDYWHASGPVQTFANRVFSICGTPGTYEKDHQVCPRLNDLSDYIEQIERFEMRVTDTTIFELLDKAGGSWKIYKNDYSIAKDFVKYIDDHSLGNVVHFDNFAKDANKKRKFLRGKRSLPTFSIIEPLYGVLGISANSNHPGGRGLGNKFGEPVSVYYGEKLLRDVCTTLHNSPSRDETLLIVTYDEHGGLFDHVCPPKAASPFPARSVEGFQYDRYGVRVPTLFINPYIPANTIWPPRDEQGHPTAPPKVVNGTPFDHTSIIATLLAQYDLGTTHLTPRDASAPTLEGLIGAELQQEALDPATLPLPPSKT